MKKIKHFILENNDLDERLLDKISTNNATSIKLARHLLRKNKPLPEKLMQAAYNDPFRAHDLAAEFLDFKKDVPETLIRSAAKFSHTAGNLASKFLLKNRLPLPEILIKSTAEDAHASQELAWNMVYDRYPVPDIMMQKIASDSGEASFLADRYLFVNQSVPEILIQGALKRWIHAKMLAHKFLDYNQPVPEILKKYLDMPWPESIRKSMERKISEDEEASKQDLDTRLLQKVSEDPVRAYRLALLLLKKNQPVPEILIKSVSRHAVTASWLAGEFLKNGKPVPEILKKHSTHEDAEEASKQDFDDRLIDKMHALDAFELLLTLQDKDITPVSLPRLKNKALNHPARKQFFADSWPRSFKYTFPKEKLQKYLDDMVEKIANTALDITSDEIFHLYPSLNLVDEWKENLENGGKTGIKPPPDLDPEVILQYQTLIRLTIEEIYRESGDYD